MEGRAGCPSGRSRGTRLAHIQWNNTLKDLGFFKIPQLSPLQKHPSPGLRRQNGRILKVATPGSLQPWDTGLRAQRARLPDWLCALEENPTQGTEAGFSEAKLLRRYFQGQGESGPFTESPCLGFECLPTHTDLQNSASGQKNSRKKQPLPPLRLFQTK